MADNFTKTYNSFSGVDMIATFGGKVIGELQGISYTVQREKAPIYTMGQADPRSFSRGKRGIAGSLVFTVFDRSALLEAMRDRPYVANRISVPVGQLATALDKAIDIVDGLGQTIGTGGAVAVSKIALDKVLASPHYLDQVLPFDVVLSAGNEYGAVARMQIHGVEIMNVGSSMSIDDITTDEACTFIATSITPWSHQAVIPVARDGANAQVVSTANRQ